jgi:putative transposase
VLVHPANIQEKAGAALLLERVAGTLRRLGLIYGDSGYQGPSFDAACEQLNGCRAIIVRRPQGTGFAVLPRRWVVERTFAWLGRNRRLSKDYEQLPTVSEAFVMLGMIRIMLRRATAS